MEEETEIYHVASTHRSVTQGMKLGYVLEEIDISSLRGKYDSFAAERFRPATEDDRLAMEAVEALMEECAELEFLYLD